MKRGTQLLLSLRVSLNWRTGFSVNYRLGLKSGSRQFDIS